MSRATRLLLLAMVAMAGVLALTLWGPITQHAGWYHFPDQRTLIGIPSALNVLSNLPFLIVGLWGLWAARRSGDRIAGVMAAGIVATGLGSAWYHLAPSPQRLLFDRLPMTVVFTTLLVWVAADRLGRRWARALLPALAVGVASLLVWYLATPRGTGDLRPYLYVQGAAMVLTPLLLLLFPRGRLSRPALLGAAGVYGVAKLFEQRDGWLWAAGHVVSGHTVKHLVAGAACAYLISALPAPADTARAGAADPLRPASGARNHRPASAASRAAP